MKVVPCLLVSLAIALVATATAQDIDVPLERYRKAMSLGEVGTVRGRAFAERRKPSASDLPLAGTDRKSTRLNSSHIQKSRMPSSA